MAVLFGIWGLCSLIALPATWNATTVTINATKSGLSFFKIEMKILVLNICQLQLGGNKRGLLRTLAGRSSGLQYNGLLVRLSRG